MKPAPFVIILWIATALALRAQTPVDQIKAVKPDGRVHIENVAGSVTVTGWDRSEVHVKGTLGRNTEPLLFEISDGTVRIEVHPKKNARGDGDGVLVIQVPRQSRVEVDTVSADIRAKNISGAADLHTVSGSVEGAALAGDVSLESVSGEVSADAAGRTLRCASVSGEIRVTGKLPSRVEMESVSGGLTYDGGLGKGGEIKAETVSGSVEIRLPASVSAEFEASTFSGDISGDLGASLNVKKDGPVGKSARFRLGAGDGRVRVETFSGSVRFVKK